MIKTQINGWIFYEKNANVVFDENKVGKWMYFFNANEVEFVSHICEKAIEENVVLECKHTDIKVTNKDTGVSCFYINCDDNEAHKRVLDFFLKNNLIPRLGNGNLKNISFKLDSQTRANQYGTEFEAKIRLSDFVNLETGEWIL